MAGKEVEIDLRQFIRDLRGARTIIGQAARTSIRDIMDDWKRESTDIALLDKSTLRREIHYRTEISGLNVDGYIRANATEQRPSGERFNYAYYWHEVKAENPRNPSTPGTEARFLDIPAESNADEWVNRLENDIKSKIRGAGF